ncbi:MAG: heme lyase CcmF/NrfE family subunit [Gammaproteobacteria bacterium]
MIGEISHFFTIIASCLFLLSFIFSTRTYQSNHNIEILVSRVFSYGFYFILISFLLYVWLAIQSDFSIKYIAQHSNKELPVFYKISSIWSAHEGSMFLWILFLALWSQLFNINLSKKNILKAPAIGLLAFILFGFLMFLLFTSNPFEVILPIAPINGADINPVLQDPALAIHPPFLYLGYVGFVIAFAYNTAFLIKGDMDINWERVVRPWSLAAWILLTIGISLGSWWAYYELGWGGYWFWDPVENVALMPWLAGTALIHSLYVSSRTKALKSWTILLSISVFSLSLFGAFIVRSGIIDSIHSFANDPQRGLYLLGFSAILITISLAFYAYRLPVLISTNLVVSKSKEAFLSINNIIFATLIFAVFLGVMYPLIFDFMYGERISVGPPYYNTIFAPLTFLASIFLVFSVGSLWKRSSQLFFINSALSASILLSTLITLYLVSLFNDFNWWFVGGLFSSFLILFRYLILIIYSFYEGNYFNKASAIAHIGLGLLILATTFNASLSYEKVINIKPGETYTAEAYEFTLINFDLINESNYDSVRAKFSVKDINSLNKVFFLYPEKRKYFIRGQITSESAIKITPTKDIYMTLGDQLDNGYWVVNIQYNYLIRLIWIAAGVMCLGALATFTQSYSKK